MKLIVNGQTRETPQVATVADLLESLDIPSNQVAVEVNLELVPRARHATHPLAESDQVEVVRLVGGG